MDLFDVLSFLFGVGAGSLIRVRERVVEKVIAVAHGPERVYARFHFKDGRVEVKPFVRKDHSYQLEWRGRLFEQRGETPDGITYEEI